MDGDFVQLYVYKIRWENTNSRYRFRGPLDYDWLVRISSAVLHKPHKFVLQYADEDGDMINVESNDDLYECVHFQIRQRKSKTVMLKAIKPDQMGPPADGEWFYICTVPVQKVHWAKREIERTRMKYDQEKYDWINDDVEHMKFKVTSVSGPGGVSDRVKLWGMYIKKKDSV